MNEIEGTPTADIKCPSCGGTSFTTNAQGVLVCEHCRAAYDPSETKCPVCGAVYDPEAQRCPSCDAELTRECPSCGALNPPAARHCLACGQAMGMTKATLDRITRKPSDQLRRVRRKGTKIKAQEEAASRARLEEMWAEEERRRRALAEAKAERERRERLIITIGLGVIAFTLLAVIVFAIIRTSGAPSPPFHW